MRISSSRPVASRIAVEAGLLAERTSLSWVGAVFKNVRDRTPCRLSRGCSTSECRNNTFPERRSVGVMIIGVTSYRNFRTGAQSLIDRLKNVDGACRAIPATIDISRRSDIKVAFAVVGFTPWTNPQFHLAVLINLPQRKCGSFIRSL